MPCRPNWCVYLYVETFQIIYYIWYIYTYHLYDRIPKHQICCALSLLNDLGMTRHDAGCPVVHHGSSTHWGSPFEENTARLSRTSEITSWNHVSWITKLYRKSRVVKAIKKNMRMNLSGIWCCFSAIGQDSLPCAGNDWQVWPRLQNFVQKDRQRSWKVWNTIHLGGEPMEFGELVSQGEPEPIPFFGCGNTC